MIYIVQPVQFGKRLLYCESCKTFTVHALDHLTNEYVCGCGTVVSIIDGREFISAIEGEES